MKGKLLKYGDEKRVEFDNINIIDVSEKRHGLMEFKILCRIRNGQGNPDGRYIIELDDGRKGVVLVIGKKSLIDSLELVLDGEGVLKSERQEIEDEL